jgi:hypothetical protein
MDWQKADTAPKDDERPAVIAWLRYDLSECEIARRRGGVWIDEYGDAAEPPDFFMFLERPDAF